MKKQRLVDAMEPTRNVIGGSSKLVRDFKVHTEELQCNRSLLKRLT
ncbi:MAG: hypothetical protein AABZ06_12470 [Bdellovibrionota bacterium]